MNRPTALFDFDKTLYKDYSLHEVMNQLMREGIVSLKVLLRVTKVHARYQAGKMPYEQALAKVLDIYARALTAVPYDTVLETTRRLFQKNRRKFADFTALLAPTHHTVIVTGSPQFIGQAAAEVLGIDQTISTIFAVEEGVFTGKISQRLAYEQEKVAAVHQALPHFQKPGSFAFGDSEGDVGILGMAEHAICINPSRGLRALAKQNHWLIANSKTIVPTIQEQLAASKNSALRPWRSTRRR